MSGVRRAPWQAAQIIYIVKERNKTKYKPKVTGASMRTGQYTLRHMVFIIPRELLNA